MQTPVTEQQKRIDSGLKSLENLAREVLPMAGQIVLLYRSDLVRLMGVGMDETDLYYITSGFPLGPKRTLNITWASAVGHIDPLRGHLPDDVYTGIDNHFTMNNIVAHKFSILWDDRNTLGKRRRSDPPVSETIYAYTLGTPSGLIPAPYTPLR